MIFVSARDSEWNAPLFQFHGLSNKQKGDVIV